MVISAIALVSPSSVVSSEVPVTAAAAAASSSIISTLWVGIIAILSDVDLSHFMSDSFDVFFIELCISCSIFIRLMLQLGFMITS